MSANVVDPRKIANVAKWTGLVLLLAIIAYIVWAVIYLFFFYEGG